MKNAVSTIDGKVVDVQEQNTHAVIKIGPNSFQLYRSDSDKNLGKA